MKEMIGGCCVCSDDRGYDENPIVYCDGHGCNVAVHQACYGIITVPTGPWFCRKCESQERAARVRCELCPQKEGALKRTDAGGWCHVVCALYIPEVSFGSINSMEPIILKKVPQDRYTKSCYICEEQGRANKASTGACMQCNYRTGCKHHFHVTCAQSVGLLREESGTKKKVSYCGYCSYHFKKLFNASKKDPLLKTPKSDDGEYSLDKIKSDKLVFGDLVDEENFNMVKSEFCNNTVKNTGKFTTANFIETTISDSIAKFDNLPNISELKSESCTSFEPHQPSSACDPPQHTKEEKIFPSTSDRTSKINVPQTSAFAKAPSSITSDSFSKFSHSSLAHSSANQFSDSSSMSSLPSFGQYISSSQPNDFSEIRAGDNLHSFGSYKDRNQHAGRVFKVAKRTSGDKKQSNRGRKAKDSLVLGEPPLLTSPPPPLPPPPLPHPSVDFTDLVSSGHTPYLQYKNFHNLNSTNQQPQQNGFPFVPIPPSLSSTYSSSSVRPSLCMDNLEESGPLPTSLEQLLETQWHLSSDFIMQQGKKFDISSFLTTLYQIRNENRDLEREVEELKARKNHLMYVNARLSAPLTGARIFPDDGHLISSKSNKSPKKNELSSSDGLRNNTQEKNENSSNLKNSPIKNQQSIYSLISNGLVNIGATATPLGMGHTTQQPSNPPGKSVPSNNSAPSTQLQPPAVFGSSDKLSDLMRRQQVFLNPEQQAYIQRMQQQQPCNMQMKEQNSSNVLPFIISTSSHFPTQLHDQNQPAHLISSQQKSNSRHIPPKSPKEK